MSLCDKRAQSGQAGEKIPLWTNMIKDPKVGKQVKRAQWAK